MLRGRSRKFCKGRSRKIRKFGVGNFGKSESEILPPTPQPCFVVMIYFAVYSGTEKVLWWNKWRKTRRCHVFIDVQQSVMLNEHLSRWSLKVLTPQCPQVKFSSTWTPYSQQSLITKSTGIRSKSIWTETSPSS